MYNFRYYAIGHSYLKHGPFLGWQREGFWGMAASSPEKDYFHKFMDSINESFDCKIEAIAENHAPYERLCTVDATEEKYLTSAPYAHMEEVFLNFKPNIISVFIGGGNTPANDEKSLTRFFEVLYALVARCKIPEAVVICVAKSKSIYKMAKSVADKYGFICVDVSFLHKNLGRDNPYYAFSDYPEYDERVANGAVEFRTHPNDKGHLAIANALFDSSKSEIAKIPEGDYGEDYVYEKYAKTGAPTRFEIKTEPKMRVSYFGFNLRQSGDCVIFGSAPGTGASLFAEDFVAPSDSKRFFAELQIDGAKDGDTLKIELGSEEFYLPVSEGMHRYEVLLPCAAPEIKSVRIVPSTKECVLTAKRIGFEP